jgi:enoyl-CoA hydratase/carnithine racemase
VATEAADALSVERRGHVAFVEIHRPPHNFFDIDVLSALADVFEGLGSDKSTRATVLCSEGKNFCAGADLSGKSGDTTDAKRLYAIAARLASAPLPCVAAVQGRAVGGGLGLTLVADFRVATPETRFVCNFARLGFHQGFGLSVTLPAAVGQQKALELFYTGRDVHGEEALAIGLADRLTPLASLRETAYELAASIAASGPLAVAAIRETMRGDIAARILTATNREAEEQARLRDTADFREGVAAMAERRPPNFTGQ